MIDAHVSRTFVLSTRTFTPRGDVAFDLALAFPSRRRGGRQEIALRFRPNGGQAASGRFVETALAHKSDGYLEGQPLRATTQVAGTVGIRW